MALRDSFDYRSAAYALIAAGAVGVYAFGSLPLLESLSYVPLALVALTGIFVPVRERIPEHDRLLTVGLGVVGVYGLAAEGLSLFDALFALAGVASVVSLLYERVTGRSTRLA
ncbi:hypothetical protein J2752_000915 [Halarchaeum rubridurum]|uniref:ISNCY family transposase ISH7B n=1 Tax=Halarchaeum rubridurum TaxID=489911 RepID=A0A830FKQ8_9EURY|nr:hypothetical protein [Halarchaeum rubridurum]MBP1954034.1 hypothetical protein [Halarchaeum rubridurum]GGM56818.1 ISNCY family transposase ISH7B [Halarchaeum rubridurum]